jgi:hypothetical protein
MFSVGQKVWHRASGRSGKVLECDGGTVYILQDNGAELDLPAAELSATPPKAPAVAPPPAPAGYVMPERRLTAAEITPEHVRVLGAVPVRTMQAIAVLFERRRMGRFDALDVAQKLNLVAEVTGVPYRTMRQYSDRSGELGLLMGKGLADSQKRAG